MGARTKNIILLGNGKPALDCLKVLLEQAPGREDARRELVLVLVDDSNTSMGASLAGFCAANGVPHFVSGSVNDDETMKRLRALSPDIIFSVNNFQILRKAFLDLPTMGVINFHNAPLPRYAGLNACTWALVDGRTEHGVTWHLVDEGVDSGDILAQELFPIPAKATALQLIMECIKRGVELFARSLDDMVAGTLQPRPQDLSGRIFHLYREIPNKGRIDFSWTYGQLDRFVRGLNFNPFPTELAHPKVMFGSRFFHVDTVESLGTQGAAVPGTVLVASDELVVAVADGAVRLTGLRGQELNRMKASQLVAEYGIKAGALLNGDNYA